MKYKKSSAVLVFNDAQKLALQLRAAKDDTYPLHWDFSAAGGIDEGEPPGIAAARELKEELGIESPLTFIGEYQYQDIFKTDTLYLYKTIFNGQFKPDPVEVEKVQFFSLDEVKEMIESKTKFHPEFLHLWRRDIIKP